MAITDTTFVYPGRLVPVTISSCASRRCPSSSAPIASPFRSCAGRNDQSRRAPEPEPDPKAKHARSRCPVDSAASKADAAPVIRSAVSGTASRSLLSTTSIIRRPGYPRTPRRERRSWLGGPSTGGLDPAKPAGS